MAPPRHLVLRNLAKAVERNTTQASDSSSKDPPLPKPGDMQLYSYYKPSLVAAEYTITTTQEVRIEGDDQTKPGRPLAVPSKPQVFEVVAPQFTLDPKGIHSTYPPTGHADEPRVLPHVVLNDSHLPWERPMGTDDELPWLAVLPFDPTGPAQELRLTKDQLEGTQSPLKTLISAPHPLKQETTLSLRMSVAEYFTLPKLSMAGGGFNIFIPPFSNDPLFGEKQNDPTVVDVIFLTKDLFENFFLNKTNPATATKATTDLTRYKYLSHVRNVNTAGMTNAGVEDTGLFGIIHSHRTGPTDIQQDHAPRTQVVHLVSLEFIEEMKDLPTSATDTVALISLYSWTYLCQPPLSVNFVDSMAAIGQRIGHTEREGHETSLLRCPDDTLKMLQEKIPDPQTQTDPAKLKADARKLLVQNALVNRLSLGYSLVRQRAATGEQTVAFMRGALVPVTTSPLPSDWPMCSNNGQEYQILDRDLGIMDLSYSSAWQLGKTVAVADSTFVAALVRLRGLLHASGIAVSKKKHAQDRGFRSQEHFMSSLPRSMATLNAMSKSSPGTSTNSQPAPLKSRWGAAGTVVQPPVNVVQHSQTAEFKAGVRSGVIRASAGSQGDGTQTGNEINPWTSTDWGIVHNWILDRMYLDGIPNQYLITDPTHLPPERIRFFHVDPVWMECLVDGALSVANHLSRDDDNIRQQIKQGFNDYLKTLYDKDTMPWYPQVPVYGFFLRSKIVSVFPDLRVEVPWSEDEATDDLLSGKTVKAADGAVDPKVKKRVGKAEILLQRHMGKDVMLVLLDRLPDSGEIAHIRISQPPHQQRFSTGDDLDTTIFEFEFRKIYRDKVITKEFLKPYGKVTWKKDDTSKAPIYDWQTKCLDLDAMNTFLFDDSKGYFTTTLTDARRTSFSGAHDPEGDDNSMKNEWEKASPFNAKGVVGMTSSFTGLQLNDPVYYLDIKESSGGSTPATTFSPGHPRTLRVDTSHDAPTTGNTTTGSGTSGSGTASGPSQKPSSGSNASSMDHAAPRPSLQIVQQVPHIPTGPVKAISRSTANTPTHLSTVVRDVPAQGAPLISGQFICSVRPSTSFYQPPPGSTLVPPSFVYIDTPYTPDLIFSIKLNPSHQKNLFLHEIQLEIPLGLRSTRPDLKHTGEFISPGLMTSYTGSGGRMLSNQRWVLHHDRVSVRGTQENYHVLRLIPRTMLKCYSIGVNTSLTFQLNECLISGFEPTTKTNTEVCHIKVTEIYRQYTSYKPDKWDPQGNGGTTIVVVKKKGWLADHR